MFSNRSPSRLGALLFFCVLGLTCGRESASEAEVALRGGNVASEALPGGAQVVVSGDDLTGFWSRFKSTRLYTELIAIEDVRQAFTPLNEMQSEFFDETGIELDEETVMEILGSRFDLGYYGPLEGDRADMLLVAEVDDESAVETLLSAFEPKLTEEEGVTFSDAQIAGTNVRVATNPTGEVALYRALDDGRLTVATTEARMQESLEGGASSMADVDTYAAVVSKLPEAELTFYVDMRAIQDATMQAAVAGADPAEREKIEEATSMFGSYNYARAFGAAVYWSDEGVRMDQYTLVDDERQGFARIVGEEPAVARSLALQPASTLVYFAINAIDPQAAYEEIRAFAVNATRVQMDVAGTPDSLRGNEQVDAAISEFEQETGIDIEDDILAWVGDEASLSITGVDRSGFFPLPEVAIMITSRDAVAARTLFGKLEAILSELARAQASMPLTWQSEEIEGATIRYAATPVAQIAYTVTDEYALIATGTGLVSRMMDAESGGAESLAGSESFQALGDFYPDEVNGIGFIDIEKTLTEVEGLMDTFGAMASPSAADSTSTGRRVIRALKNAPRAAFYAEADDDGYIGRTLLEVR